MAIELTISDLRNLDKADGSLLFAVNGDTETFSLSVNTLFEYTKHRLGYLETGGVEMYLGEVVPPTHTELDGKSFNPLVYPKMGALFPSGVLPDTRGMMLKHAPSGRRVLSFEANAILSHGHNATTSVSSTDLGTKTTGTAGNHSHSVYARRDKATGGIYATYGSGADNGSTSMSTGGDHSHTVSIGSHSHSASTTVSAAGSSKNLVDNIAVKFIIKKA